MALARALVNQPDVLLLDEPMSALDAKLRAEVQLELRRLQRRIGKTFILVTHDQNEAMTVSDRIFVMCEGRIVQSGPPVEVYDRPVNRFVAEFLGTTNLIRAWRNNGTVHTEMGDLKPRAPPRVGQRRARHPARADPRAARPARRERHARRGVRGVLPRRPARHLRAARSTCTCAASPAARHLKPGQEVWLELPTRHLEALGE